MTQYAGQTSTGGIKPTSHEIALGLKPELFFTEADRRLAYEESEATNPVMEFDTYVRLREIADTPYDHQAQYFLNQLYEKARRQGEEVVALLSNDHN